MTTAGTQPDHSDAPRQYEWDNDGRAQKQNPTSLSLLHEAAVAEMSDAAAGASTSTAAADRRTSVQTRNDSETDPLISRVASPNETLPGQPLLSLQTKNPPSISREAQQAAPRMAAGYGRSIVPMNAVATTATGGPPITAPKVGVVQRKKAPKASASDDAQATSEKGSLHLFQHAIEIGARNEGNDLSDPDLRLVSNDSEEQADKDFSNLGYHYQHGAERGSDPVEAFQSYHKAAQQGDVTAMINVGVCYANGTGSQKHLDLAMQWWEKAAHQVGGANELYKRGCAYIKTDIVVGFRCLSIASLHGHKKAMGTLLRQYQTSSSLDESKPREVHGDDPSDCVASFLLAELLSTSSKLMDLDEATAQLANIPRSVPFYTRSQWLVPFLEEKKHILFLNGPRHSFPNKSDFLDPDDLAIVALIGEGQFGKVYLAARDRHPFRWAAVKYLNDEEFDEHPDAVTKLMRERLTNQIIKANNVPHTVGYIGFVTDFVNNKCGLVFDVCADLSLVIEDAKDRIQKGIYVGGDNGNSTFDSLPDWRSRVTSSLRSAVVFPTFLRYDLTQMVGMFRNTGGALQCIHGLGLLHRDIADRNVFCDGNGNVQLADFGMSRFIGVGQDFDDETMLEYSHKLTAGNQYAVAWWAPECVGKEPIFSFASDVYSFSVMVWQCLAGEDPFQSLIAGGVGDPFVSVCDAIIAGQRPDLNKLRNDTPDRLRKLMQDSWAADPLSRPTLAKVISELDAILAHLRQDTASRPIMRRRGNQVQRAWFDVKTMYLDMPRSVLIHGARSARNGSFSPSFLQRLVSEKLETAASMTVLSESTIKKLGGRRPYDVFIVHSGAQKFIEASSLKTTLELAGLRCFLDRDMMYNQGRPIQQMEFALKSCRYVVVIISRSFLTKMYPCLELQYAFDRAQWFGGSFSTRSHQQAWRSLRVILFDLSAENYANAVIASKDPDREATDLPPLPALGRELILKNFESGLGTIEDWTAMCEQLAEELIRHDRDQNATTRWNDFLQSWETLPGQNFPSSVYCSRESASSQRKAGEAHLPEHFVVLKSTAKIGATIATTVWRSVRGERSISYKPSDIPRKKEELCKSLQGMQKTHDVSLKEIMFVVRLESNEVPDASTVMTFQGVRSNALHHYREASELEILQDLWGRKNKPKRAKSKKGESKGEPSGVSEAACEKAKVVSEEWVVTGKGGCDRDIDLNESRREAFSDEPSKSQHVPTSFSSNREVGDAQAKRNAAGSPCSLLPSRKVTTDDETQTRDLLLRHVTDETDMGKFCTEQDILNELRGHQASSRAMWEGPVNNHFFEKVRSALRQWVRTDGATRQPVSQYFLDQVTMLERRCGYEEEHLGAPELDRNQCLSYLGNAWNAMLKMQAQLLKGRQTKKQRIGYQGDSHSGAKF